jgi:hypothetical protein
MSATGTPFVPCFKVNAFQGVQKLRGLHRLPPFPTKGSGTENSSHNGPS